MKHITAELEAKIRRQIAFVEDRSKQYLDARLQEEKETGNFPPVGANEAESSAWKRALQWVLFEGECK